MATVWRGWADGRCIPPSGFSSGCRVARQSAQDVQLRSEQLTEHGFGSEVDRARPCVAVPGAGGQDGMECPGRPDAGAAGQLTEVARDIPKGGHVIIEEATPQVAEG